MLQATRISILHTATCACIDWSTSLMCRPLDSACKRMQACVLLLVCVALAGLLPAIEYVYILRKDPNMNIAFAAAIWAGCALLLVTGAVAYVSMMPVLMGAHAALTCIAGCAMVVAFTNVYYFADLRCAIAQASIEGCSVCDCAATNTCITVRRPPVQQPVHPCAGFSPGPVPVHLRSCP